MRELVADSVATAGMFSLDLGFLFFIWGSGVIIENLFFLTLVKFFEIYAVIVYFPFKNTIIS